jgi:hypothetical protein
MVCACQIAGAADEASEALSRQIPGGWTYNSFDEAVQQIEQKTGFKVFCPEDLRKFMKTVWIKGAVSEDELPELTVQRFLDWMGRKLALKWQLDQEANSVTLSLPWEVNDARSPSELLKAVRQSPSGNYEHNSGWQTAFNALLSNKMNFDNAWKVRQKASLQRLLAFTANDPVKPILMKRVVDKEGAKYVLILICQEIEFYPGHGSVSYYWFKEDGTLVGAGLMNTGHRCDVVDATIDNEYGNRTDQTTELQMILKMNLRDFMTAMFVLGPDGLELTHLLDLHGATVNNVGINVGQSLMRPDTQ